MRRGNYRPLSLSDEETNANERLKMITEQEMQRILSLADKIQMEVNRMCVTDDIEELDTMSIHIREDLRKLRDLRYEKLSDNNDITESGDKE